MNSDSRRTAASKEAQQCKSETAGRRSLIGICLVFAVFLLSAVIARAQDCDPTSTCDVGDNGGPIVQGPTTVFLIFWLPSSLHYDTSVSNGDTAYQNLMARFFNDVSGSSYFNILTQYPSTCGVNVAGQTCLGTVTATPLPVDTSAYSQFSATSLGTGSKPLQDSDIQAEVLKEIAANNITPGLNTEFFVFTASGVQECLNAVSCTNSGVQFCAYHGDTTTPAGNPVIYAFMPQVNSLGSGCQDGISKSPNGQAAADQEIAIMSHEFFESVSDPQVTSNPAWGSVATGFEIGDNCVGQTGALQSNGSNVTLNGDPYVVQQMWSNDDEGCVLTFSSPIPGPSVEYSVLTGGDDLRDDSSSTSNLDGAAGAGSQTFTLKTQPQAKWASSSTHVRVFQTMLTQPVDTSVTLASHSSGLEGPDNWNIQSLDLKLRNPNGSITCEQSVSGNPAARLTQQAPTQVFATPNCAPATPPASINQVHITIQTGKDNARSDTELWATLPGEPSFCLKPSNNANADGVCSNGGSATDQNGQQSWENWTTSAQSFSLPTPQPLSSLGTITIKMIEHNSGFEGDDNWDLQGIIITMTDTTGATSTVLNMSNPQNGDNCMARLKGSPNPSSVTYNLSAASPGTSNLSNPTFGATPPGSCPQ